MKTTVKISKDQRLVIQPFHGQVQIEAVGDFGLLASPILLTPDTAGALIFGIEQALEKGEVEALRKAA